jgi:hypothetical protein
MYEKTMKMAVDTFVDAMIKRLNDEFSADYSDKKQKLATLAKDLILNDRFNVYHKAEISSSLDEVFSTDSVSKELKRAYSDYFNKVLKRGVYAYRYDEVLSDLPKEYSREAALKGLEVAKRLKEMA